MEERLYDYCRICGKRIAVGEFCFDTADDRTICTKCCAPKVWKIESEKKNVHCEDCVSLIQDFDGKNHCESKCFCTNWKDIIYKTDVEKCFCYYGELRGEK